MGLALLVKQSGRAFAVWVTYDAADDPRGIRCSRKLAEDSANGCATPTVSTAGVLGFAVRSTACRDHRRCTADFVNFLGAATFNYTIDGISGTKTCSGQF